MNIPEAKAKPKPKYELIVGTVVVLSFIILSVFVLMVSGISTAIRPGYHLYVFYDYIRGVSTGSLVKYAGVNAGEVVDMDVVFDSEGNRPQIKVKVFLNKWVDVRERSSIFVRGSTPLSEPHLEIIARGIDDGARLEDGAHIKGISPTPIEDLVANAENIAQQFKETVTKINNLLDDPAVGNDVRDLLHNLSEVTGTMNVILKENQSDITGSIQHFNETLNQLEGLATEIKQGQGSVGKLVGSDELYQELLALVKDIRAHPWKLLKKEGRSKFLGIF